MPDRERPRPPAYDPSITNAQADALYLAYMDDDARWRQEFAEEERTMPLSNRGSNDEERRSNTLRCQDMQETVRLYGHSLILQFVILKNAPESVKMSILEHTAEQVSIPELIEAASFFLQVAARIREVQNIQPPDTEELDEDDYEEQG